MSQRDPDERAFEPADPARSNDRPADLASDVQAGAGAPAEFLEPAPRSGRRRAAIAVAVLLLAAAAGRLAGLQGWVAPIRIAGDSMAETLVGEHLHLACADCRFQFLCGVDGLPGDGRVVCPNCGFADNASAGRAVHPGQRVLIDRFAYWRSPPARGDLIALRDPQDERRLVVKRIVGLPGESIGILGGDLLVDGRRRPKSLDELLAVAVVVHDDSCRPERSRGLPERWSDESGWTVYRHWRGCASPRPRTELSPVLDNDAYNQNLSRSLHEVGDQILEVDLTIGEGERFAVRASTSSGPLVVLFDARDGGIELRRPDELEPARATAPPDETLDWTLLARRAIPVEKLTGPRRLQVGFCDRRLLIGVDGSGWLTAAEVAGVERLQAVGTTPWAVAPLGPRTIVRRRRLLRDLYYLDPFDLGVEWTSARPAPPEHYWVLGDNPAVSVDSRHWPGDGVVPKSRIVGRVLYRMRTDE